MSDEVKFRWIDGPTATQEDWERIDAILATRGWMALNRLTSRILVAERDGALDGFIVLQMVAHTEPLWVAPSSRATGLAEELSRRMFQFMHEVDARGFVVVAESRFAEVLCEAYKMKRVASPVYVWLQDDAGGGVPSEAS